MTVDPGYFSETRDIFQIADHLPELTPLVHRIVTFSALTGLWNEPADSTLVEQAVDARHATLMAIDWEDTTVGFHLNGTVTVERGDGSPRCVINIEEAYIHYAKHIPPLERDPHTTFDNTTPISPDADIETLYSRLIIERIFFMLGTADTNSETDISPRFGPRGPSN